MAFRLRINPRTLTRLRHIRPFSSSTPPLSGGVDPTNTAVSAAPPSPSAFPFSDIKNRLRPLSSTPLRIPFLPPPLATPALSLTDIRNHLTEFRAKSAPPTVSFHDLLNKNVPNKTPFGGRKIPRKVDRHSIFDKEIRKEDGEAKAPRVELWKMYSYEELGEKLRKLRPAVAVEGGSLFADLRERLVKLWELEEKEGDLKMGGMSFRDLRESLLRIKEAEAKKKASNFCWRPRI